MKKSNKFFLIDSLLIGLLAASGASGLLLWFIFPRRAGWHKIRWFFKDIHKWSGLGLAGLGTYHFLLHWDWFINTGRRLISTNNKNLDNNGS
jgi:hypothetical protein